MPNPYFKFKQFTVFHDRCAMKIGTDGVLLGAWTQAQNCKKALDIGTGCGLIALMLAQQNKELQIDAIEIDPDATQQAQENCNNSIFSTQVNCFNRSLQQWATKENFDKYDLIVSNPPFFDHSLKSANQARSTARHSDQLNLSELISIGFRLLSDSGKLSIIYPWHDNTFWENLGKNFCLYPKRITNVYPTPKSLPKRSLIEYTKVPSSIETDNLIIESERHIYSEKFQKLASPFYLKL